MSEAVEDAGEAAPRPAAPARPAWRRAVALVTVVSLMNAIAGMLVLPVLPKLVEGFTGSPANAAPYVGGFAAAFALIQFVASPVLGSLSDAYGRRAVILISAFGMAADYVFMALAPSVGWLFVGRMISGLTAATGPAVNAYIADSIPPEERAGALGWTGAAMSIGILVGPAIGGVLGDINPRLPFWAAAGFCMAVALWGVLVLPESLPKDLRQPFKFRQANPFGAFAFLKQRPRIATLVLVASMMFLAAQCLPTTLVLYAGDRYHWSARTIGLYFSFAGFCHLVVQSQLVRRIIAAFGERKAAILGYASTTVGFLIFATVPVGILFPLGTPFYVLAGVVGPAVQSQLMRLTPPTEQGRLQGANAAVMAMTGLVAPLMFTGLFAFASGPGRGHVPLGLHLYVAAAILASGAILAWRFMAPRKAAA